MLLTLAILSFLSAAIPCALFCYNLRLYTPPPQPAPDLPAVSILIPARNEAEGIGDAIRTALLTTSVPFELVIMDDASTDGTAGIIREAARTDPRVRYEQAPPLPAGWNGKQHACWALAQAARNPILCFIDADVRLTPDCIARMATFLTHGTPQEKQQTRVPHPREARVGSTDARQARSTPNEITTPALVSGFPRQLTDSPLEWLLIPLIHFVLLGFLPLARMRKTTNPGFAAGCGQFFMCSREAYFETGGHSGIKLTMHDGLRLPRLFREHGYRTDLADLTPLASVRMYTNTRDTWQGLAKNATEGIAAPTRIVPISIILILGQLLPFIALARMLFLKINPENIIDLLVGMPHRYHGNIPLWGLAHLRLFGLYLTWWATVSWLLICLIAWLPRILAARRFRQDWRSALLHPFGILVLLAVQWYSLIRKLRGGQVTWRNRSYTKTSA